MIALNGLKLQLLANTLGLDSVFILCRPLSVIRVVHECEWRTETKQVQSVTNTA